MVAKDCGPRAQMQLPRQKFLDEQGLKDFLHGGSYHRAKQRPNECQDSQAVLDGLHSSAARAAE